MTTNAKRENTPTEQNKEDNALVLYRLTLVESAVKEVGLKIDKADNIKRSDLVEFRDAILARFSDIREDLQKQIDSQSSQLLKKADIDEVSDLRTLVRNVGIMFGTVITGLITYYLTYGRK
jgi:hypothetical protein